ncbi:MAG: hypothetical protein HRT74_11700, partial [Flavobacteriales bacterium]|nr:hypothetical protein [Flavobacteriales bacterium]
MKVLFSGVNMSSIIKMLCVLVLLICYRDGFSQKPQTQILKHELSKKALKKGRLSASAMSQDSANYYTVFNYQPKKKQPAQRDVSVFNSDGSFKEVLTYPMSADLFKELNLRPLTEEEEMSIASDHGFSPGPAVVLKGFYMHVKTGRVELAGYETDLNFGLSYQGKKIPLMEGKHRLEYSFVDDSKSRYAPYYPFIAKSVRAGWRGRWEDFTPVYGVFHPDEKILFGAIMVGKVDLKSDNSDFARYRYYVGMLDGSTLEVENPQYFEFGYQLNKTMDRSIDQNGNMVVVLEGQKLKDPENPLSGAV